MGNNRDTFTPSASGVPFDNSTNEFISEDTQAAIEELRDDVNVSASPGFTWGSSGNVTNGSWLVNDSVPSNKSGRAIFINDATLESIFVRCEVPSTFDLEIYEHDGTVYTIITTVSIVASRAYDESFIIPFSLTTGKELALRLVNGSAKNPVAGCVLKGTL